MEIIPIDEGQHQFGLDRVAELVDQYAVTGFVLGLPKNMNNSIGERAEKSQAYGQYLTDRFHLPVDFIDERLTTVQADRMLIERADVSRKKRKKVIDKVAAVLILQNYLDAGGKLTKTAQ
ncbi:Putative Holliday junction resolvase [Schleiferilactobacillus shenzhenensis LY-73]|uniref:Putative pre-16S rRNA nuclease n=1 Tax=Schleiferilactobacillus shenzhenensis LY-73 TaxID=1231336 RepID=U4TJU3_9LACO|nr:Putative Holliday junction resolvase [Schleiferilactobacillus shenzhenensis LY-73]